MPNPSRTKQTTIAGWASKSSKKKRTSETEKALKKVSPESVGCIDLTGDSEDDCVSGRKREQRLGNLRKKLNPLSERKGRRKKAGLKTTGLEAGDYEDVIVIDSDSDQNDPIFGKQIQQTKGC